MATYLAICDIAPDADPSALNRTIENLGESERLHGCAWIIRTNKWHNDICGAMKSCAKPDGFITIIALTGPARRWKYSVEEDTIEERPL